MRWAKLLAGAGLLSVACAFEGADAGPGGVEGSADPGTYRSRVIDGSPATGDEFHSTVAIVDETGLFCTGTLVAPTVVITAAHCMVQEGTLVPISVEGVQVAYGSSNVANTPSSKRVPVSTFSTQGYNECNGPGPGLCEANDIAVLMLSEPITDFPSAPILASADVASLLTPGTPVIISGYGQTSLVPGSAGILNIATTDVDQVSATELLVGAPGTHDTCLGDSGGPVYLEADGEFFLVGVTSRGRADSATECGDGGVYTLAPAYTTFIETSSGGAYPPASEPGGNGGGGAAGAGAGGGGGGGAGAGGDGGVGAASGNGGGGSGSAGAGGGGGIGQTDGGGSAGDDGAGPANAPNASDLGANSTGCSVSGAGQSNASSNATWGALFAFALIAIRRRRRA